MNLNRQRQPIRSNANRTTIPKPLALLQYVAIGVLLVAAIVNGVRLLSNRTRPVVSATDAELKVAFIGDTGFDEDYLDVLELIRAEQADFVVHLGDFDYDDNPNGFFEVTDEILGADFPVFGIVGNHDADLWDSNCGHENGCYADLFAERLTGLGIELDDDSLDDQMYATTYRGLRMVFVGEDRDADDPTYASFVTRQLAADDQIWKICAWHENQEAMQVGDKDDRMGWEVYEACREQGAIIVNAHTHVYSRSHTLIDMTHQIVHPHAQRDAVLVGPGQTFVAVPSIGGHSIRDQVRCLPPEYPYGCKGEWASIYGADQGADYGALFITFNVDNDPYKAQGYFKNINGEVIDFFTITATTTQPTFEAVVLRPLADTFVSSAEPDTNFGSEPLLEVDAAAHKISYLKFDISDVDTSRVISAYVRLRVDNPSEDEQFVAIAETNDWDENEITYNMRLETGPPIFTLPGALDDVWVSLDITNTVRQWTEDEITVVIDSNENDGIDFVSSDGRADHPELVLVLSSQRGGAGATPAP